MVAVFEVKIHVEKPVVCKVVVLKDMESPVVVEVVDVVVGVVVVLVETIVDVCVVTVMTAK